MLDLIRSHDLETDHRVQLRAEPDGKRVLFGHAAVFNSWTEIDSTWEGHFRERFAPGAFNRTLAERGHRVKALYDHGHDPTIGNKPLGPFRALREDGTGLWYEVELLSTDYNRDFVIPAAEAGVLGASLRFRSVKEEWDDDTDDLPERTIRDAELYELGPVTFPAYEAATAGVRSRIDAELWRSVMQAGTEEDRDDLARLLAVARRLDLQNNGDPSARDGEGSPHSDTELPDTDAPPARTGEEPTGSTGSPDNGLTADDLRRRLTLLRVRYRRQAT